MNSPLPLNCLIFKNNIAKKNTNMNMALSALN